MQVLRENDLDGDKVPRLAAAEFDEANELNQQEEKILDTIRDVKLHFIVASNSQASATQCTGCVYVTSRRVVWVSDTSEEAKRGYAWDIRAITVHAISRDVAAFTEPCLYCQKLFEAFSNSAMMNPDDDEDAGEGEQGDWIYNVDEIENGSREAELNAHFDSILQVPSAFEYVPGQFDDAEEAQPEDDEIP